MQRHHGPLHQSAWTEAEMRRVLHVSPICTIPNVRTPCVLVEEHTSRPRTYKMLQCWSLLVQISGPYLAVKATCCLTTLHLFTIPALHELSPGHSCCNSQPDSKTDRQEGKKLLLLKHITAPPQQQERESPESLAKPPSGPQSSPTGWCTCSEEQHHIW